MTGRPAFRPKKSLGQNFLRDENIARKILNVIDPQPGDTLLEIGPGEGALTKHLVGRARRLILVELDDTIALHVRDTFTQPDVSVLHADILDIDIGSLAPPNGKIRVAGNIPYNITAPILFHLLDHRKRILDATLMMQKEVAERIIAPSGGKEYGILSVFFQLYADVAKKFDVSAKVFRPAPKVTSAVVHLAFRDAPRYPISDEEFFRSMIREVFGKRRKMLRGSLRYFLGGDELLTGLKGLERRPEELTIAQLAALANALKERRSGDA